MIVDRGHDFPQWMKNTLERYGSDMWLFRDRLSETTRAANIYQGDDRGFAAATHSSLTSVNITKNRFYRFKYLTPRIRLTPADIVSTSFAQPNYIHFICSPQRAEVILHEVDDVGGGWSPTIVYEPIPVRS
jgi:hypothetical protein